MEVLPALSLFLARLAAGYALCLAAIGWKVTQGSWPRVSLFVIAGLAVAAIPAGAAPAACATLAAAALVVERARTFRVPVLGWTAWMAAPALWLLVAEEGFPPAVGGVLGGVAAGGTLGAMLLGHSYLTARGLSFAPLDLMARGLFALLCVRGVQVGIAVLAAEGLQLSDWIFLSARGAFGLLLPLVFGWMVIQCVKIRSNQSATGILYAMTALVGAGELIAAFLQRSSGIAA